MEREVVAVMSCSMFNGTIEHVLHMSLTFLKTLVCLSFNYLVSLKQVLSKPRPEDILVTYFGQDRICISTGCFCNDTRSHRTERGCRAPCCCSLLETAFRLVDRRNN